MQEFGQRAFVIDDRNISLMLNPGILPIRSHLPGAFLERHESLNVLCVIPLKVLRSENDFGLSTLDSVINLG